MPKTKEEKAEYDRQYYLDNKEKLKEHSRKYKLDNKEKRAEYDRQYYLDNKEKIKEQTRKYNLQNKEKIKEYRQSLQGKKSNKISSWKTMGLLWDTQEEIDEIYERWLNSERCEKCNIEYTETNIKNMDHEHKDGKYGKFRNVLCNRCNIITDRQNNKSGVPNVYWSNTDKKWIYKKTINGKTHKRTFINKEDTISYKKDYEKKHM